MESMEKGKERKRKNDGRGEQCFAWGCSKRYKIEIPGENVTRSESSGSSDEESAVKRKVKRSFH